ncbi:hypothetical protein NBO_901g0001 [Nosema bombycis CQ1]|uniref:Uncharacterized protein n=1 Tax=Nosema bombycis (strain CQ1 / CVCC 102059) TaxID=578461 RepID=R0KM83_NOSB1|nr:hypothetical protein NBO_901g0001 [Nosema bombycis CQ1]|eukprot:EOB11761.1 hypothetical protein NBO_901g0001 [Nosema bombycis CQ1]
MIGNINNDEFKHKSTLLKIGFLNTTSLVYDILLEVLCRENETIKSQYKTLDNIFVKMEKYFENLESLKETLIKN